MRTQRPQRVDGIRFARAIDFKAARVEERIVLHGGLHHGETVFSGADAAAALHPRVSRRHEHHPVELEHVAHLLGAREMPHMDRIERAAHDAEPSAAAVEAQRVEALAHDRGRALLGRRRSGSGKHIH